MFKWLNRRKTIRRDDDLRAKMEEVSRRKIEASKDAIRRLNQIKLIDPSERQPA